ncbi:MAG: alkaline shock response membrane anchor protein AmaP [Candidatus Wallacebacter cryptica]|jgi:uncharacterized alkaline shock family protein YloU|nr:alkaline shock response membrane anchor protein AmaP [Bacillota bacterium]
MTVLDRLILAVVAIVLLVGGVLVAMTVFGSSALLNWLVTVQNGKLDGLLLVVILLLLVVYIALMLVNDLKRDERALARQTHLGSVRISVQTISELVSEAVKTVEGIKDAAITVTEVEPLSLDLELRLLPDHSIPHLTELVQASVSDYLQQTIGTEAAVINVNVKGVLPQQQIRVQ